MGIQIVPVDKVMTIRVEGVEFHVRRPSTQEEDAIRRTCSKRGEVQLFQYGQERLKRIIKGWGEGIADENGTPIVFDPERIMELPLEVRNAIVDHVEGSSPLDDAGGNSGASSTGG